MEYPARVVTTTPATISVTLNATPETSGAHAEGTEVFLPPLRVLCGEHARQYTRDEEDGEERGEPVGVHGDCRQVRDVGTDGSGDPDEDCRCQGVQHCTHERPLEDREQRQPAEQEDAGMGQRERGDVDDVARSAARRRAVTELRPPPLQGTDHHRCCTEDRRPERSDVAHRTPSGQGNRFPPHQQERDHAEDEKARTADDERPRLGGDRTVFLQGYHRSLRFAWAVGVMECRRHRRLVLLGRSAAGLVHSGVPQRYDCPGRVPSPGKDETFAPKPAVDIRYLSPLSACKVLNSTRSAPLPNVCRCWTELRLLAGAWGPV